MNNPKRNGSRQDNNPLNLSVIIVGNFVMHITKSLGIWYTDLNKRTPIQQRLSRGMFETVKASKTLTLPERALMFY